MKPPHLEDVPPEFFACFFFTFQPINELDRTQNICLITGILAS